MKRPLCWKNWGALLLLVVAGTVAGLGYRTFGSSAATAQAEEAALAAPEPQAADVDSVPPTVAVTVVHPKKGALSRFTTQPGSVHAFETVQLFAKVSGFLKSQKVDGQDVDIGFRIKKDQVLAVVDVPELEKQAERDQAAVDQARAKVVQMNARVSSAQAELEAAHAKFTQAEANAKSAMAWVNWRTIQHQRMKALFAERSIEEKIVDESKERKEAAIESKNAADAAIGTAKADIAAKKALILQAQADVTAAESEVKVAQAELARVEVLLDFAKIRAPFDGVVTYRGMFPKDFVRSANENGSQPLFTVQRTDKMRVVVLVPDRDVIYTDVGDPATLEVDALPGRKFSGAVSRIARSQDPQTRLMRVEIDLLNPTGELHDGMYGRATILLDKGANMLSIPSGCIVNKSEDGSNGSVYVVRDGQARVARVRLGEDNGLRAAVVEGLRVEDSVVVNPGSALSDGAAVTSTPLNE